MPATALTQKLTIALAVLLIAGYGLGLLFSLKTHREIFASAEHAEPSEPAWPIGLALVTLAIVTVPTYGRHQCRDLVVSRPPPPGG